MPLCEVVKVKHSDLEDRVKRTGSHIRDRHSTEYFHVEIRTSRTVQHQSEETENG